MVDQAVKARVNLYGLFKALELLPTVDRTAEQAIAGRRLTIEFRIRNVGTARLHLHDGNARLEAPDPRGGYPAGHADVVLWFSGPEHFNAMIDGKKQPIPLKGFQHLGFLSKGFTAFTGRLEYYLRPAAGLMDDPEFFAANTRMTAYVAFHALSEIGNFDHEAHLSAKYIPDGVIQVEVLGDLGIYMTCDHGSLVTHVGRHDAPRCVLWFADIHALNDLLTNRVHVMDAVALGNMGMRGYVPMIDYLSPVLGRISAYLS